MLTSLPSVFLSLFVIHLFSWSDVAFIVFFPSIFNVQKSSPVCICLHSYRLLVVFISTLHFFHFLPAAMHAVSCCRWFLVQLWSFSLSHLVDSYHLFVCPFERFKQYLFSHDLHSWSSPLPWNLLKTHNKFISTCTGLSNRVLFNWNSNDFSHIRFCPIIFHSVICAPFSTVHTQSSIHYQCPFSSPDHGMESFDSRKLH